MIAMRATDIVRHRRERLRRANRPGARILRFAGPASLLVLLTLLFVPVAGATVAATALLALARDLPDVTSLAQLPIRFQPVTTTTRLYAWDTPDADGLRRPVLIDEIADPRLDGSWLPFASIPSVVVDAHLAMTDPQFLATEPPPLLADLTGWRQTGAIPAAPSPITDALIRDHLRGGSLAQPGDTRRAFQDWLLAREIGGRYSRAQQLEWALNTTYYGHLAYGIEAAARVYFGKSAADLDAAEAALLAAVARDPAANPFDDLEAATRGRSAVLDAMVAAGTLTPEQAAAARRSPLALAPPPGSDSIAPEFARLARRELEAIFGPERLLSGGFQVETTLDLSLQEQAACLLAARAGEPAGSGGGPPCPARDLLPEATATAAPDTSPAIVALDLADGTILALAGDAADAARPLGTLAQPLIYLTALSQGHSAATLTMDVPGIYLQDGRPYSPHNADGQFLGPMRLREAMAAGRLVPATEVLSWVGVNQVLATARELGLRPDTAAASPDLAFAGDGFPAALLDVGQAFATIGHDGITVGFDPGDGMPRPATIRRALNAQGEEVYKFDPDRREALSSELAWLLTDMLADRASGCPASGCDEAAALPDGRRVATAAGESAAGDGWAIGYTPDLLVGTLGGADAATVQRALLAWATAGTPLTDWSRPAGLRAVDICEVSGLLLRSDGRCPIIREWFAPGTEPTGTDTMVREVAINQETGRLATIFTPPQLIERRTYFDYPPAAAAWVESAGVEPVPTEYDTVRHVPTHAGGAAVQSPEPWSVVSSLWSVIGSAGGEGFAYYRLAYFPGLLPEAMQTIVARGETAVDAAELGIWDTTLLDDGLYTLLLTVVRQDGTFDEVAIPVTVENE